MKKHRILVCGGRKFHDTYLFYSSMATAREWFEKEFVIIEGGATGADAMAFQWAKEHGVASMRMVAQWDYHGRNAGHLRNGWMLKWGLPDLVIAFPGGSGTKNMVDAARKYGVDIWEVK
jgi:predicted Rossmann-fold nucleotide-binding protein